MSKHIFAEMCDTCPLKKSMNVTVVTPPLPTSEVIRALREEIFRLREEAESMRVACCRCERAEE